MSDRPDLLDLPAVAPLDADAMTAAHARWASRAKPPGSLGQLHRRGLVGHRGGGRAVVLGRETDG